MLLWEDRERCPADPSLTPSKGCFGKGIDGCAGLERGRQPLLPSNGPRPLCFSALPKWQKIKAPELEITEGKWLAGLHLEARRGFLARPCLRVREVRAGALVPSSFPWLPWARTRRRVPPLRRHPPGSSPSLCHLGGQHPAPSATPGSSLQVLGLVARAFVSRGRGKTSSVWLWAGENARG